MKSAVVTGAGGGGSGRAIAVRLARAGFAVAVSDVNDAGGRETAEIIGGAGGRAAYVHTDVADEGEVRALIGFAERELGPLGVLVNNASTHDFEDSLEGWKRQIEVDLLGGVYAMRHAIEAMRRAGGGAIVNVASISALWHGRRTEGGIPAYDAAKAGLIRLTTALAGLAASDRIRVNCVAPGWIATHGPLEFWQSLTPRERLERGVPAKLLMPEDIAEAVFRLATDETLAGRVLVWWSEDAPCLIAHGDRGYREAEDFEIG